jgi:hypothetical protein
LEREQLNVKILQFVAQVAGSNRVNQGGFNFFFLLEKG